MAKEFKAFDAKYARGCDSQLSVQELEEARRIGSWNLPVDSWSIAFVRNAVYEATGFEEWQKFRVSLKGQSTQVKLYRLRKRWYAMRTQFESDSAQLDVEKCRIDNYIGALKRGGQLDECLVIKK